MALTDLHGGVTERFGYSPYGVLMNGDASRTPFLFNGMYGVMSDANGLYYMRARFYHPQLRRFLNADLIRGSVVRGQSINRFVYGYGNPVSYVDPKGEAGILVIVGGAIVLFVGFDVVLPELLSKPDDPTIANNYIAPSGFIVGVPSISGIKASGALLSRGLAATTTQAKVSTITRATNKVTQSADSLGGWRIIGPVDDFRGYASAFGGKISENSIGQATIRQLQNLGDEVVVKLDFVSSPPANLLGRWTKKMGEPNSINIFVFNNSSIHSSASTFIHEARHAIFNARGQNQQTQFAEYMARAREYLFTHGVRPNASARAEIRAEMQRKGYSTLPWR